jgi:outer membrane protein OmpA-like peptidoglycan-associated protein
VAACAQPQRKVTVTPAPPTVRTIATAPPPAPPPPRTTVIVPPAPQVTVVQDEAARREAEAAKARAAEAERLRREEADRATAAEARASDAEQARQAEAAAREEAERRAGDFEREIAAITAVQRTERGLVATFSGDVLFEFDRTALLPQAQTKLGQLAAVLSRSDRRATIEGHTDGVGTDAYNQDLSQRRAVAVRDHLVAHGVAADRLQVVGRGESSPVAANATPEGRAMNRRVEIIIDEPSVVPLSGR